MKTSISGGREESREQLLGRPAPAHPDLVVQRRRPEACESLAVWATALILARVFGNSPDFWLNAQRRSDLWEVMHSPRERERIERARPQTPAA